MLRREPPFVLPGHERVTDAEVCPDMEACREHVQRLAPWDYKLWSKYSGKFNEMVGEGGEAFKARVEALEADSSAAVHLYRSQDLEPHAWEYAGEMWAAFRKLLRSAHPVPVPTAAQGVSGASGVHM